MTSVKKIQGGLSLTTHVRGLSFSVHVYTFCNEVRKMLNFIIIWEFLGIRFGVLGFWVSFLFLFFSFSFCSSTW